ncbi:MAG: cohesin domain-containing protein [Candidatus Hydrogenedentes bacterium]|nr:cohesin domain-containing protein [Candidatus Hydrogenedentota bacterium]
MLSISGGTNSLYAGSNISLQVVLSATSTEKVSAMQFDIEYSSKLVEITEILPGEATLTAQKQLSYNRVSPDKMRVIIAGFNQNIIPNGVIAVVKLVACKSALGVSTEIRLINPVLSTPQGTSVSTTAYGCSLTILRDSFHTADKDKDWKISLDELLRVVQIYNSRKMYCECYSEDGYSVVSGSQDCFPHSSDYNRGSDWRVDLYELLRLIQIYNYGAYHPNPNKEDGFDLG